MRRASVVDELVLSFKRLSAEEAVDWGLVDEVTPAAELKVEVRTCPGTLASCSPTALRVLTSGETEESKESMTPFDEKRRPDFATYRSV